MTFYTELFTSENGPLARIWLAAHWERKLTKAHVFECNLESTIRDMISPKIKIGLRTSGHLLIGVVRIYSRKAKYLLSDCNEAMVQIKIAFRPGLIDMPAVDLTARVKAITLAEDFTAFDNPLPSSSNIDFVDHFSLNQSRKEEITLKEDFRSGFLHLVDFGDESQSHNIGLLDMSFQSLAQQDDTFGDEDKGLDFLDFLTNPNETDDSILFFHENSQNENPKNSTLTYQAVDEHMQVETPTMNETTLVSNVELAFALEPVAITPNSEKKMGKRKRKRKLIVDAAKELSREFIRAQLSDYSDLVAQMEMSPPTVQLMLWKENGGVHKLFSQPCSSIKTPQLKKLFSERAFLVKKNDPCEEVEMMRQDEQEAQSDISSLTTVISVVDSSIGQEQTPNTEPTGISHMSDTDCAGPSRHTKDLDGFEFTQPELPSEDSMFVHPAFTETQSTSLHTKSLPDSQDFEERKTPKQAQKLLNALKSKFSTRFSLQALCEGVTRSEAASSFSCLLVLAKQRALHLQQSKPYEDIVATPGPKFYDS